MTDLTSLEARLKTWHAEMREGFLTSYSSVAIVGGSYRYSPGLINGAIAICLCVIRALSQKTIKEEPTSCAG